MNWEPASLFSSSSVNFLKTLRKSQLFCSAFEIAIFRARCHLNGIYLILSSEVLCKKICSFYLLYHSDRAVARLESWSCCDRGSVEVPWAVGAMFPVPGYACCQPNHARSDQIRSEASWNKISLVTSRSMVYTRQTRLCPRRKHVYRRANNWLSSSSQSKPELTMVALIRISESCWSHSHVQTTRGRLFSHPTLQDIFFRHHHHGR